ncbi:MAG: DUF72 domain-containing protein, partial [Bdellovibrionales bacterium]|nr:DUF72 domain-containing protein [Ramlibacter sp.]
MAKAGRNAAAQSGVIRSGTGGWTYEPWRDNFYPKGLAQSKELAYAAQHLTAIEVNGTYYSTFKPPTFAKWHDETPDHFMFSLKANRFATNRKVLGDAGESIARFTQNGLVELGPKLGPIVWQFMPTKVFDPVDFEAFLKLLPKAVDGVKLRHALDVRHASFMTPIFLKLARKYKCAAVFTDSDDYPSFADITGSFVYARLMRTQSRLKTGYAPKALDRWAQAARIWQGGGEPPDVPRVQDAAAQPPAAKA